MTLQQLCDIVKGNIFHDPVRSMDYRHAFASDLMSDVLRFHMENAILITGLSTIQTIRTAEISNLPCIVVARGKQISNEMIALASENHIALVSSPLTVFEISGKLYMNGIKPVC
jgi:predicted transcriptional regulator